MSRQRRRGRAAPQRPSSQLLDDLGLPLSWPVIGLTVAVLLVGFGPLALASLLNITGAAGKLLVALGPALVCVCFAALTYVFGTRAAADLGWSRRRVWLLTVLFLFLGALAGWGLFVSV